MDCGSFHEQDLQREKGKHRYIIFAAKLYADSGTQKLCTRHSIRLDRLMELVSQRIRDYIGAYYHLEELELAAKGRPPGGPAAGAEDPERPAGEAEYSAENLYLDKVSGVLSEGQFVELNQDFLEEKSRLGGGWPRSIKSSPVRTAPQSGGGHGQSPGTAGTEDPPRELAVMLIEKIEVGEQDRILVSRKSKSTGNFEIWGPAEAQRQRVRWKTAPE